MIARTRTNLQYIYTFRFLKVPYSNAIYWIIHPMNRFHKFSEDVLREITSRYYILTKLIYDFSTSRIDPSAHILYVRTGRQGVEIHKKNRYFVRIRTICEQLTDILPPFTPYFCKQDFNIKQKTKRNTAFINNILN